MASEKPVKYAVQSEKWTHRELTAVANKSGICVSISSATVGQILREANIKPHRSKYWEFPNIEDLDKFNERVAEICAMYAEAK